MKVLFAAVVSCGMLASVFAAEKSAKEAFAPGDKVEIQFAGELVRAEVTSVSATGQVTVKFRSKQGVPIYNSLPPGKIKLLEKRDKIAANGDPSGSAAAKPGKGESAEGEANTMRTWSDNSGRFKVQARFVKLKDDVVTLEQEDGTNLAIEIEKLDEAGRETARRLSKFEGENPFKVSPANPFKPAEKNAASGTPKEKPAVPTDRKNFKVGDRVQTLWGSRWWDSKIKRVRGDSYLVGYEGWSDSNDEWVNRGRLRWPGEADDDAVGGPRRIARNDDPFRQKEPEDPARPLTQPDTSDAEELQLLVQKLERSKFAPDPAGELKLKPRSIVLKGGVGAQWPYIRSVRAVGERALIDIGDRHARSGSGSIEQLDLKEGKSKHVWQMLPESNLAAYGAAGQRAVVQSDRFFSNTKARLDVYSLSEKDPKFVVGFRPYDEMDAHRKDVTWTELLDADHLLTVGGSIPEATLVLWEIPSCKAVWRTKVPFQSAPAVSPGGKQLAVAVSQYVVVLNALTGEPLVRIPNPYGGGSLGFSPNGEKLALVTGQVVVLFDLVKGELVAAIANNSPAAAPVWTDSQHVLAGSVLFSVSKKSPLWTYRSPGSQVAPRSVGGVTWFVHNSGVHSGDAFLVGLPIPSDEAIKAEKSLNEQALLLRPGSKISLEVNVGADTPNVVKALTKQLEETGMIVEPGQQVRLRASIQVKPEAVDYKVTRFGQPFNYNSETVKKNVNQTIYTVEIVGPDNKPAWQISSSSGVPMFFYTQGGESIDAALQREMQVYSNSGWFSIVKIPTHVPKAESAGGLGTSMLTPQGFVPAN